jgi:capsular polysaccharide biosynthesis protein
MHARADGRTDRELSGGELDGASSHGVGDSTMEIGEYLRVIRKRAWVVLLIPALAASLMTPIVLSRPTEYSATATIAAPWLISNAPGASYATANGARQFVADFTAATSIPPVVDAVAHATGASPDSIRRNITAIPIGESTLIQVRYIGTDQREAEPVARALALVTLRFLFRPSAVAASSSLEQGTPGQSLPPVERLELLLAQPETVSVSPTRVEPTGPHLIRGLQVAVGGGLLLGLLVVIALEMLPFGRRRIRTAPNVSDEAERNEQPTPNDSDGAEGNEQSTPNDSDGAEGNEQPTPNDGDGTEGNRQLTAYVRDGAEGNRRRRRRRRRRSPNVGVESEGSKMPSPKVGDEGNELESPNAGDRGNKRRSPNGDQEDGNKRKTGHARATSG